MNRFQTYYFITKCLSLDFHPEYASDIREKIRSDEVSWPQFFITASSHLVLQLLYRIFCTHSILEELPVEASEELKNIYTLVKERNEILLRQSIDINTALTQNNITPIFTKGMGHLMNGLYTDLGERLLADIDILVSNKDLMPAVNIFKEMGFITKRKLDPKQVPNLKHYPRFYKVDSPAQIELHWEPIGPKFRELLSCKKVYDEKMPSLIYPDCHTMSWKHAIQHNFIHSQLEHRAHAFAKVYLRNMVDLLLLSEKENIEESLLSLNNYQKESASYIILTDQLFNKKNLSSTITKNDASQLFLFRHDLNLKVRFFDLLFQLIPRIYHSYIRKFFRSFIDKELRKLIFRQLGSRSWYKHHLNTYKRMFRGPKIDES